MNEEHYSALPSILIASANGSSRMSAMHYVGHLSRSDPLYGYLRHDILPRLGMDGVAPEFRVHRLRASNHVDSTNIDTAGSRIVGKFFQALLTASPMKLTPAEVPCVGNDMFREIRGAQFLGIRSIFVDSNHGAKPHVDSRPDSIAAAFQEVLEALQR